MGIVFLLFLLLVFVALGAFALGVAEGRRQERNQRIRVEQAMSREEKIEALEKQLVDLHSFATWEKRFERETVNHG